MLFDLIHDGFSIDILLKLCSRLFVMICILPIHEFAHALVATKLGDNTARASGRLTINPLAHIDLFGALLILIAGFGYAKPVPVNPYNFKDSKKGMALTAAAGPLSNLILAFIFTFFYCAVFKFTNVVSGSFAYAIAYFFMYTAQVNISLAVFNLIPVPPLDGSRILRLIIPDRQYAKFLRYEKQIVTVLFILIIVGAFDGPMAIASSYISKFILKVAAAMFGMPVG